MLLSIGPITAHWIMNGLDADICNQGCAVKELTYDDNGSIELLHMLKLINCISCCVLYFSFVSNLAPLMLSTFTIFGICK